MKYLNQLASRYFSLILWASCALAFFVPVPGKDISWVILLALFSIIFVSFFQFRFDPEMVKPALSNASGYVIIRFLVIPLAVYAGLITLSPFYAFVIFFLLLMPAAVSSPAFTSLFGARINLSMLILIISSFFSIPTISILTPLFYPGEAQIGMSHFLFTLLFIIVLPFVIHLPLRKLPGFAGLMTSNISLVTVIALSVIFVFAISGNRSAIIENPVKILEYLAISFILFMGMYAIGWLIGIGRSAEHKITFSISSGMNNIGLAVSLATLYLPGDICIFLIIAEFAWVGILLPLRILWKNYSSGMKNVS